jgi:cystathionine beta-lyase
MRYNVLIFSDEIHADLVYSEYRHVPISSLDNFSEITITGFSPAKSFNVAGLSTSVIVAPEKKLFEQLNSFNEKLHLFTGNSFGIKALEAAYLESEAWLEALVKYLEENRDFVYRYFREQMPEIRINNPEGTYLAWLDFSALVYSAGPEIERVEVFAEARPIQ